MSAIHPPSDLDGFLPKLSASDPRTKLQIGSELLEYLSHPTNSIVCSDIGSVVDTLVSWLHCSNFKVVQLGLDILIELIARMQTDFQPYISGALPNLVDKLGDSKEVIREKTLHVFRKIVQYDVVSVQTLFDRISGLCFGHKNSNVREQIMRLLVDSLNEHGPSALLVSKLVPYIVKLLGDPNASVRCTAFDTICELYKYFGEKLRADLQRKYSIPNNKLPALMNRFDEIRTLTSSVSAISLNGDVPDQSEYVFENTMTVSAYRPPMTPSTAAAATRKMVAPTRRMASSQPSVPPPPPPAGAVTEETFSRSFEMVPTMQIYSGHDVEDCLRRCETVIENVHEDWSKRVDCLKRIRSLVVAGGVRYDEFHVSLSSMLPAFLMTLKDLRSQVVREACVTLAYLSTVLADKFERVAEATLTNLLALLQNAAKCVSSAALVCIRFVLRHTHSSALIPIIISQLRVSKSKDIRRACCEFVHFVAASWPQRVIEKHLGQVQEAIKRGVADADAEARQHSRRAFFEFARLFPEEAESVRNSLDPAYRKALMAETSTVSFSHQQLPHGSCHIQSGNSLATALAKGGSALNRSCSAVDPRAAKRAKTRAQYAAMDRQKCGSTASPSPSTLITSSSWKKGCSPTTPEPRSSRSAAGRVSISQPSSRSASPSSKLSYLHCEADSNAPRCRRSSADNAGAQLSLVNKRNRPLCGSRESSLNRYGAYQTHLPMLRKFSSPTAVGRTGCDLTDDSCAASFGNHHDRSRQLLAIKLDEHESFKSVAAAADSTSYDSGISQMSSLGGGGTDGTDIRRHYAFPDTQKECDRLKALVDELSEAPDERSQLQRLSDIQTLVRSSASDALLTHFKLILGQIVALIAEQQTPAIKQTALQLLQTIVKRKTVTFLLRQFSDLVIVRVIALCGDANREAAKAAEACAITLSTHLPPEAVLRVVVPLVTAEATGVVRLVAVKMLHRLIECAADEAITPAHVDQIMPALLVAYDDPESAVRKSAVFGIVALHKQSEEMKILLEPYIGQLQGGKLKLLQLYIRKAEQGSSMPTSPRNV